MTSSPYRPNSFVKLCEIHRNFALDQNLTSNFLAFLAPFIMICFDHRLVIIVFCHFHEFWGQFLSVLTFGILWISRFSVHFLSNLVRKMQNCSRWNGQVCFTTANDQQSFVACGNSLGRKLENSGNLCLKIFIVDSITFLREFLATLSTLCLDESNFPGGLMEPATKKKALMDFSRIITHLDASKRFHL